MNNYAQDVKEIKMCQHKFLFPEDKPENYNRDGRTLTGRCKCGVIQEAKAVRWMARHEDNFLQQVPYGKTQTGFIDKMIEMW